MRFGRMGRMGRMRPGGRGLIRAPRKARFVIAGVMVVGGLFTYYRSRQVNPVTGETQAIALTTDQEVALGLKSAPRMAAQFGGLDRDAALQADIESIGQRIVARTVARTTPYKFKFSVLKDGDTVNAFALPGGPIFITRGLLRRLTNEAQVAGVLGHEIGHVVGRHAAEKLAKGQLAQILVGAVGVAASDDRGRGREAAHLASFVANVTKLSYGREDELQADALGVELMAEAGYDPRALTDVMGVLAKASAGRRKPEFLSSHPDPGDRGGKIQELIGKKYPQGLPPGLGVGRPLAVNQTGGGFAGDTP